MSPLSNRQALFAIAPGLLRARLQGGWWRRRTLAAAERPWDPAAPLGEAAAEVLKSLGASARGAVLDVEIANACVHLDVAEGDFAGHSNEQLGAVAGACVRELLGDTTAHELRWHLQTDERHLLICAIPRSLTEPLRGAAAEAGLRLRRVEPAFGAGWARHGAPLAQGLGVIAFSDGDYALAALARDGIVQALSSGAQPDLPENPCAPLPAVDRLLNGLGLEDAATPTRLDAQVARLVTGVGLEMQQIEHFVAVLEDDDPHELSSRWTVFSHRAER
ncbi:MAG: hypothetical protein U1F50_03435 [Rubrivivax sp.]